MIGFMTIFAQKFYNWYQNLGVTMLFVSLDTFLLLLYLSSRDSLGRKCKF